MTTSKTSLGESDAAEAYARMWNRCDLAPFMQLKIARNVTTMLPVWSDGAPAGVRIQTFRGRNMLAAMRCSRSTRSGTTASGSASGSCHIWNT